jgi:hypothetical protein
MERYVDVHLIFAKKLKILKRKFTGIKIYEE